MRRNKALAEILESAAITDASGNTVDLSQLSPAAMADILEDEDEEFVDGLDDDLVDALDADDEDDEDENGDPEHSGS